MCCMKLTFLYPVEETNLHYWIRNYVYVDFIITGGETQPSGETGVQSGMCFKQYALI